MSERHQLSVDINLSPSISNGMGLTNIMLGVGENIAYRAERAIEESGMKEKHLKVTVNLVVEEVGPEDIWMTEAGRSYWGKR